MQALQNEIHRFEELDAQVLGVSPDGMETHEEFQKKHGLSFPLIPDQQGTVQKLYAPGRVTFLIDRTGAIREIQKGMPDTKDLLQLISRSRDEG